MTNKDVKLSEEKLTIRKSGFTLIEIIVVVALLGIISIIVYSLLSYGFKGFNNSSDRSINDIEVRTTTGIITRKIRFASSISISNSVPTGAADHYYIYIDSGKIYQKSGTSPSSQIGSVSDYILQFTKISSDTVGITVGRIGDSSYNLSTNVKGMNMNLNIVSGSNGSCVDYTK